MRDRELMDLDERFALGGRFALLAARFHFGNRDAEPLRERADRFLEANLVLQLDELEDVAADAAAKAVKEPAVAVDVE